MLLKKKFFIVCALFLLLFSTVSYAQVCEVGMIKQVLRKVLHLYFTEPATVSLTKEEVRDLLVFYLSIKDQNLTVDCSALGSRSNKPIFDVMISGENLPDKIPSCADGTKYGECSKFRPAYCYAGALYQKCDLCGCPANSICGKSNKCETISQNITCYKDIDCGQNTFVGDYYCTDNYIAKNYINYSCINAGTVSSSCASASSVVLLTYCNPNLNQTCVASQNFCQVPVSNAPTTTNQSNQTQTTGICLVRDAYTNAPVFSAPDLGKGYAKTAKPGINTIFGLQSACSQADFSNLLQNYCTQNTNPIQEQVMTYDSQGNYQSLSCGAFGCNYRNCTIAINQTQNNTQINQTPANQTPTNQTPINQTSTNQSTSGLGCTTFNKVIDFEDDTNIGGDITWNPDYGSEPPSVASHRAWLNSKGLNISGAPNGFAFSTKLSGSVGTTGVVIGYASPNFLENDQGISDNEVLTANFLGTLVKSVTVGLTSTPSNVASVNNIPSTVVMEGYDTTGNLIATTTKTFTGVTNGVYTPTTMNLSTTNFNIAKVILRTTQHPYGGVYIEDVSYC